MSSTWHHKFYWFWQLFCPLFDLKLQSVSWSLAEFRHNRIVQSPHENYFNVCRQHKEKWDLVKMTSYSNWAIIGYGVYKGLYHISCLLQIIKPFICPPQGLLFLVVKILKNFNYRYCLLTAWIKHCFNKVNAFEPVPFGADRQQQFYLYQLP